MIADVRHVVRLLSLVRTLARNDALTPLAEFGGGPLLQRLIRAISVSRPGRPGERLARALHEAGPSFIKFGQALATRSDLLGEVFAADLSTLQDRLPPFPGAAARAIIEAELGAPVDRLFRAFDDRAVAAASIAQVHRAVDGDGRVVAVKVLRPGVEAAFARDLDLFFWVARRLEALGGEWRRLRPLESVGILADTVAMEMDLRLEAAAAAEFAENFEGDDSFRVPAVDWTRTGQRVLTTEWISGIPIHDRDAIIAAGLDPHAIVATAARSFFHQVFRDGFFHGDLHPGNLFVAADGTIRAVDFGIMGRIDRPTRLHLAQLLMAFLGRDYRRAAEVHYEAGWIPADRSVDAFTQACRSIAEPILDRPQSEISVARLLGHLFRITKTFGMETQPQLLLLQKTMLVAEGGSRRLAPDVNMWMLARPLIQDWMTENLSPPARLRESLKDAAAGLSRLPEVLRLVERSASLFADGHVRLHPDSVRALQEDRRNRSRSLQWLAILALAVALALSHL